MKHTLKTLLLLLAIINFGHAQITPNNGIDYLIKLNIKSDSVRFGALLKLGDSLKESINQADLALFIYKNALLSARKLEYMKEEYDVLVRIAKVYEGKGDFLKANQIYQDVTRIKYLGKNKNVLGEIYINIGYNNHKLLQEKEALHYYNKALKLYLNLKNEIGVARVYKGLAVFARRSNDFNKAKDYSDKAKSIFLKYQLLEDYASCIYNEAFTYYQLNDYAKAKEVTFRSIAIDKKINSEQSLNNLVTAYMSCVYFYVEFKQFDSAYYYLNLGKHLADSLNTFNSHFTMYNEKLGYYYTSSERFDDAIKTYKQTIKGFNGAKNGYVKHLYEEIANVFAIKNKCDSADYYRKIAMEVQDTTYANELKQNIASTEEVMRLMEQDFANQKRVLETEKDKEKLGRINILLVLISGFLTLGILLIVFFYRNYNLKIKKENLISQVDFLKAQLNPHFLFNSINNIYVLIDIDFKKAAAILLKFSDLLRYQLYECNVDSILLSREIQFIENFILFEKLRYENRIAVVLDIPKDNTNGLKIAPLILQPFIENAFKHVPKSIQSESFINISLRVLNKRLILKVENNYDESESKTLPGGIGLSNVKKRLELLYKGVYKLQTEISTTKYCVSLILDYD